MDYAAIGKRIREIRKLKNLSQEQLAERVWISTTHMSHIETGSTKLSLPVMVDLANALEIGVDDILGDQLNVRSSSSSDSIQSLLNSCNSRQLSVLEEIIKAAKTAMDSYM